jgi:hypothetical protein
VVGESRTGKTVACDAYRYRQKPQQEVGKTPIVSVVYIQPPQKCHAKDLFQEIIEYLKFKATKGTVSDFRGRKMEVLKGCRVEMIIIDEADRIKPETFAEMAESQNLLLINFNSLFWIERSLFFEQFHYSSERLFSFADKVAT